MILEWDKTGEHYVETGTDHGVLYTMNADGTYNNGEVWNGLTSVEESPEGAEPNELYADDIKYVTLRSAERLKYTITAWTHPDSFYECDGTAEAAPGVYFGQQARTGFGFTYRTKIFNDTATEADDAYKLHIYYNSTASPSSKNYETINDNPDGVELSWECDATGVPVAGHRPVSSVTIDSRKIDAAKLKLITDTLYGTSNTEPTLPLPSKILELIA